MKRWLTCITAGLLLAGCAARVPVTRPFAYEGWPDAYRLSNGVVDVVVVPAIGRVVRYGYVGGENLLWDNSALHGRLAATRPGQWANFGGEKIYPWPQDDWSTRFGHDWPPPPGTDPVAYRASILADGSLHLVSDVLPAFGVRIVRDLRLSPSGSKLELTTTFEQVDPPDADWPIAVWSVAQWRSPDQISAHRDTPTTQAMMTPIRGDFQAIQSIGPRDMQLERPATVVAKAGFDADALSVTIGTFKVTERASPSPDRQDAYRLERSQIYCTPLDPRNPTAAYVELEFTAPRTRLRVGERTTLRVEWEISPATDTPVRP